MATKKLPDKRENFCHEYLVDFNGTQAAIRAKYNPSSAHATAWDLLQRKDIQRRLDELRKKALKANDLTPERVLAECKRIALCDVKDAFDDNGCVKDIKDVPDDIRKAISSFEVEEIKDRKGKTTGWIKKIKFWNKDKNLENLMKYFGQFEKDNEQKIEQFVLMLGKK